MFALATDDPADQMALRCGVLRLSFAATLYSRSHIRAQLQARRWQRPARSVLVLHNGPLTDDQQLWVALFACPPGSALAGLTSANLDGLQGFDSEVTVVIPDGGRKPALEWVRCWRSTQLSSSDVHPLRLPRRTRLPRSVLDAASDQRSPSRARAVLLATCQQQLLKPQHLTDSLARRGPCRHRALIDETITDAASGVASLPERDFDLIWRRRGLPAPDRQSRLRRSDGCFYLDRRWTQYGVALEIQGLPHMAVSQWDADLDRQNEIVILGPRLLFFTSYAVRHLAARVGSQLERALIRGGWRP
jgi:hypothetical protein